MGQRFFHLVHQHQAQVARLQARQGGVDGDEFATDFFDVCGPRCACQAFARAFGPCTAIIAKSVRGRIDTPGLRASRSADSQATSASAVAALTTSRKKSSRRK